MALVRRAMRVRVMHLLAATALTGTVAVTVTAQPASAFSANDGYRLPWSGSETWQVSRGPTSGGSHSSWPSFSAWDFFPIDVAASEADALAVGDGTASLLCDDGHQATIELETNDGDLFHYAHLDADSVDAAGITASGVAVSQGASLGTLFNDNDGWAYPCGSGTGPHLHFEIESDSLPMVIDGYTFSLSNQHAGAQLKSSNGFAALRLVADFNGDGYEDIAIGVPGQTVSGYNAAGKVHIIYGSAEGVSATAARSDQQFTQDSTNIDGAAGAGDRFGADVATGDYNGDGYADIAIGVPGETVGGRTKAGAVNVIYGSSSGLSATATRSDQLFTQDTPNIADIANRNDEFGAAIRSGDFNGDGYDDLAIGAPGEDVGGKNAAGLAHIIYGSSAGLSATAVRADQRFTQNTPNVGDRVERGDRFATVITAGDFDGDGYEDVAIGTPGEGVAGKDDAGVINVIYGSSSGLSATATRPDQRFTLKSANIAGVANPDDLFGAALTTGDFNGDGRDDLAVGAPGDGIGGGVRPGAVNVIYGSASGLSATATRPDQRFHQNSANIDGVAEAGDAFGRTLSAGDFNGDGLADIAIGVPGKTLAAKDAAGASHYLYGSPNGLSATATRSDQQLHQDSANVDGVAQAADEFGASVGAGDFNGDGWEDTVIGAPGENVSGKVGAGMIHVIYGSASGLSPTATRADQTFTESTSNVEGVAAAGDNFGGCLTGRRSG